MDDIRNLIKILEESNLTEIEVARWWGWGRVRVSKGLPNAVALMPSGHENGSRAGLAAQAPDQAAHPPDMPPSFHENPPSPGGGGGRGRQGGTEVVPAGSEVARESGYLSIRSPMVGTFFRSPAPDAEPYIEVGQRVDVGQTVCIIEAMKLMNEIESDVRGRIVAVKVENKHPVEYGQVLFWVDPT